MKILITGGAGFIGSQFVRMAVEKGFRPVVLDCLTYAGHLKNIEDLIKADLCGFEHADLRDAAKVEQIIFDGEFQYIVNFAAESHVDNSISGPKPFITTNIEGTFNLLEASRKDWMKRGKPQGFRYLQISTDEVYGSLGDTGYFSETTSYAPNSPYSASKAAADHLVRAWHETYGLPTLTTNCSNNFGPRQFPEKLIPRMITCALSGEKLPVYGDGQNIRDWIHVEDHCAGIFLALAKGRPGQTYCFGGRSERKNLDLVHRLCEILDELKPKKGGGSYKGQITFVEDRLGHDRRYAIDDNKAETELGFERKYKNFEQGLKATVEWYLNNPQWVQSVLEKKK